jgi:hypothetical protein
LRIVFVEDFCFANYRLGNFVNGGKDKNKFWGKNKTDGEFNYFLRLEMM